jgi:hypothetical protein
LFHVADTNASVMHPYRTLLRRGLLGAAFDRVGSAQQGHADAAGVAARSAGVVRLAARAADVDGNQIALFGTGLGSVAALWAARRVCKALVLEHLPSLRDMLRESITTMAGLSAPTRSAQVEFAGLPGRSSGTTLR